MDLLANVIEFAPVIVNPSRPPGHSGWDDECRQCRFQLLSSNCTPMLLSNIKTHFHLNHAAYNFLPDIESTVQVVEDGSGWRFAADDTPCTAMHYRYFVRVSVMDATGSGDVVLSNDQVCRFL